MRSLVAILASIAAFCASGMANAGETWGVASLFSYHVERSKDYCEVNPGAGFEHGGDVRLVAGVYQNSLCEVSTYAGFSWTPIKVWKLKAGVAVIALTGYEEDKRKEADKVAIVPLPVVTLEGSRWGVNLAVIPPYQDFKGAIGFQVKFAFK